MGVCPQDNLLWDVLTATEHLQFYGRIKGLTGPELSSAVEAGLRSVNLWLNGLKDKQSRAFSGESTIEFEYFIILFVHRCSIACSQGMPICPPPLLPHSVTHIHLCKLTFDLLSLQAA